MSQNRMTQNVAVAFATDHKYRYFTGVTLFSLIEHSSAETLYDIFILTEELSDSDRSIFYKLIEGRKNFSLHILDIKEKLKELGRENFQLSGAYTSISTYFRLFMHELLVQYDRILYLDSDIIIQADIKDLFYQDLGKFPIGAVKDFAVSRWPFSAIKREHFQFAENELKMKNPAGYFNAGVLLMDLDKLRRSDFSKQVGNELRKKKTLKF